MKTTTTIKYKIKYQTDGIPREQQVSTHAEIFPFCKGIAINHGVTEFETSKLTIIEEELSILKLEEPQ